MRLTVDLMAQTLGMSEGRVRAAVTAGLLTADSKGEIDLLLGQAFLRSVSSAAREMFRDTIALPAPDVVFVAGADLSHVSDDEYAASDRLDLFDYGIERAGRTFIQTEDPHAWVRRHGGELTASTTNVCLLLRKTDMSATRAVSDSYLLGDARLQQAITDYVAHAREFAR